jgi:hypothetical protein
LFHNYKLRKCFLECGRLSGGEQRKSLEKTCKEKNNKTFCETVAGIPRLSPFEPMDCAGLSDGLYSNQISQLG